MTPKRTPITQKRGRAYNLNLRLTKEEYFFLRKIAWIHKVSMTSIIVQSLPMMESFLNALKKNSTDATTNDNNNTR